MRRALRVAGVLLAMAACAACVGHPRAAGEPDVVYAYEVLSSGDARLRLSARYVGLGSGPVRLAAPAPEWFSNVATSVDGNIVPLARVDGGFVLPACRDRCLVRYDVDLQGMAAACRQMDCARTVGKAVLTTASMWLLRPDEPASGGGGRDAVVRVRVVGDVSAVATGLRKDPQDPSGFVFRERDLGESSYTAFGELRTNAIDLDGSRLDVTFLGEPLAMGDAAAVAWIEGAARRVASVMGRFPVDAAIFVVPVHGRRSMVFGRVMSLTGASVVLLFGDETPAGAAHDDWITVHELFHLACPSFVGEGRWLEEGLATYYEPILRARGGWTSESALWAHFVHEMPRGLRAPGDPPALEDRDDIAATYWGGALFALLADVRLRAAGHGSLDQVVRTALARLGDATHRARVADFVRAGDDATGGSTLATTYETWAVRGENPDLAALWASLGVVAKPDGGVALRDDAPLAAVRRAIASGNPY